MPCPNYIGYNQFVGNKGGLGGAVYFGLDAIHEYNVYKYNTGFFHIYLPFIFIVCVCVFFLLI